MSNYDLKELHDEVERLRAAGYTLLDAWDEQGTMGEWVKALTEFRRALEGKLREKLALESWRETAVPLEGSSE